MRINRQVVVGLICAVAAAVAMAAIACGNPGAETKEFVFTPVPYTVVARDQCTQLCTDAVFFDEDGDKYAADQITVVVAEHAESDLQDFIQSYGFNVLARNEQASRNAVSLLVEVPAGGAPGARALFADQPSVISVELNGFAATE